VQKPEDELSRVFSALADPTRRDILSRLADGPITAGALAANYAMSQPAISQHLTVLDNAGLIVRTVNAQWRECSARATGLDEALAWIARNRAEWTERFDFLDDHLTTKRTEAKRKERR
jgi:DNA-binding transcriptional ArsR family regulator